MTRPQDNDPAAEGDQLIAPASEQVQEVVPGVKLGASAGASRIGRRRVVPRLVTLYGLVECPYCHALTGDQAGYQWHLLEQHRGADGGHDCTAELAELRELLERLAAVLEYEGAPEAQPAAELIDAYHAQIARTARSHAWRKLGRRITGKRGE